ncbi:hypothetical protein BCR36DRAFT_370647 [Piromyces finnis]|uniref:DAPG hydrolase PhiG domain-containing protein n=1 Tax=Piromyces finnis TaxID=1754191 RepID=A0A1Y1V9A5_9FUNG|nr:hypothetical protein BCR36DRAFT_370647 [Piromyces finnis]|eukprot:ORX49625.1 hypothetical protein BCR36DRAFT_370647 [Piromyces finnis]
MKSVPLYENAEKKSYYKYMDIPLIEPAPEEIEWARTFRGDPTQALRFEDRASLQELDHTIAPEGVYYINDGTIFMCAVTETPNITGEMFEWWFLWHHLDQLRFAIWDPEDHYDVKIPEESRKRILNQDISIRERIYGVSCTCLESFNGEQPQSLSFTFCDPGEVGFKRELIGTDGCMAIFCSNANVKKGPIDIPVFLAYVLKKGPDGKNVVVMHYWMGKNVKDGEDVTRSLWFRGFLVELPSMLIVHTHKEMKRLNQILPQLYEENKDNWDE